MNRVLLVIITFSMTLGLLIGWRLPYLLEKQALSELISQRCTSAALRSLVLQKSKSSSLVEDCIDSSLRFVLLPYMVDRRKHLRKLDLKQLADLAGVSLRYEHCLMSVSHCLHNGQYKLAAEYACTALALRPLQQRSFPSGSIDGKYKFEEYFSSREEYFAEGLCSLGMYNDAKFVIMSLPEIPRVPGSHCTGAYVGYRRGVLAEAYLGLGHYDDAIRELTKPIPDLIQSNTTWAMIEFLQGFAYLAKGNSGSAKAALSTWGNRFREPYQLEVLLQQISESVDDDFAACHLSNKIIKFFEPHPDDVTTPQNLDFCGNAMKAYGHNEAARLLFNKAQEIRQQ
ncbi:MAG TPA: hypothetical protein EYM95_09065 [Candidatus Obscuribacterales bacterium]|nr:hypothetical protein [Candidatus Obscuribacterales bacterium]